MYPPSTHVETLPPDMLSREDLDSVVLFLRIPGKERSFSNLTDNGAVIYDFLQMQTGLDLSKKENIPELPKVLPPLVHQWMIWEGCQEVKNMPQWEQLADTIPALRTVIKFLREPDNQRTKILLGRFQPYTAGHRMAELARACTSPRSCSNIVASLHMHSDQAEYNRLKYMAFMRHRVLGMLAPYLPPVPVPPVKTKV